MIAHIETLTFKSADFSNLAPIGNTIIDFLADKTDTNTAYGIQLAVNEACANVVEHAYADTKGSLTLRIFCEQNLFVAELQEYGRSFNPDSIPNPDLDILNEGGLGLFLIRELMDTFTYTSRGNTNIWRLTKRL